MPLANTISREKSPPRSIARIVAQLQEDTSGQSNHKSSSYTAHQDGEDGRAAMLIIAIWWF
jgi:hypothetical protein